MAKSLKHQVLTRALELVSNERSWTRHTVARTASDQPCKVTDPRAAKYCALGAIQRSVFELTGELNHDLAHTAMCHVSGNVVLPLINDLVGREAVIHRFQRALERV